METRRPKFIAVHNVYAVVFASGQTCTFSVASFFLLQSLTPAARPPDPLTSCFSTKEKLVVNDA